MKTKLFLTGLAIMAITTWAAAQDNNTGNRPQNGKGKGSAYVDANKNGICDHYENGTVTGTANRGAAYGRNNGTGKSQGYKRGRGIGQGRGRNYIDANNNGICDRRESVTVNEKAE
ncbi:MAG: hypothetical protein JXR41_15625 [Bacteroidales bacterium]|nr:hypothetical protein [Bacteroidales bacterium]MBN2764524.1 hypothetical protein [Bacteroidales bacterium]